MNSKTCYKKIGYEQGLCDGKRTGGKVKKTYISNLFKDETQSLSSQDSLKFMKGWKKGFDDGVRGEINKMVKKEGLVKKHLYKFD